MTPRNTLNLSITFTLVLALATAAPAGACPDLSGTYAYPGAAGLDAICERNWEGREDLPLPGPGGFYVSAPEPHQFVVEQQGCERLLLKVRLGYDVAEPTKGGSEEKTIQLDAFPASRRRVEWGSDSLFLRQKFVPEGFRLPFSRNVWELRLRRIEDGGLEYHLRHLERGRVEGEVRCVMAWEPATTD